MEYIYNHTALLHVCHIYVKLSWKILHICNIYAWSFQNFYIYVTYMSYHPMRYYIYVTYMYRHFKTSTYMSHICTVIWHIYVTATYTSHICNIYVVLVRVIPNSRVETKTENLMETHKSLLNCYPNALWYN